MDDIINQVEDDYCPPLDAALVRAIVLDFDLCSEQGLKQARDTLDSIRATADEEAQADLVNNQQPATEDTGSTTGSELRSDDTDLTSLSNGLSRLVTTSGSHDETYAELERLDVATKAELLRQLFPALSDFTVDFTLKKVAGSWQRALDELLNISALEDNEGSDGGTRAAKGIDAFAGDRTSKRGRRKKRKNQFSSAQDSQRASSLSLPDTNATATTNRWQTASSDIHFLTVHSKLSDATVRCAYYANGASVPKTIGHLLKELMSATARTLSSDTTVQTNAYELGQDFPSIAPEYLTALIQLTHPSTASAHELAKALVKKPPSPTNTTQIIPKYVAPSLSDDETSSSTFSSRLHPTLDSATVRSLASNHRMTQARLSAQAAEAHRRSKSNHLYGGAASYYASASRDAASSAQAYTSAAADSLVATQSSADQLDLHGVTVMDAVRIARREVESWWAGLGEDRINGRIGAGQRARGFRIVVGRGRHSEGGRGKIGPAVLKDLTAAGWTVDREEGVLHVRGKGRK